MRLHPRFLGLFTQVISVLRICCNMSLEAPVALGCYHACARRGILSMTTPFLVRRKSSFNNMVSLRKTNGKICRCFRFVNRKFFKQGKSKILTIFNTKMKFSAANFCKNIEMSSGSKLSEDLLPISLWNYFSYICTRIKIGTQLPLCLFRTSRCLSKTVILETLGPWDNYSLPCVLFSYSFGDSNRITEDAVLFSNYSKQKCVL